MKRLISYLADEAEASRKGPYQEYLSRYHSFLCLNGLKGSEGGSKKGQGTYETDKPEGARIEICHLGCFLSMAGLANSDYLRSIFCIIAYRNDCVK
ncbi:MAG: hypothetical protein QME40_06345 [bacterium]|nr:hypothetical protein [bacterium]